MSMDIKNIPPITFSYFNTEKEKYVTLRTEEIPLILTAEKKGAGPSTGAKTAGKIHESEKPVGDEGNNPPRNDLAPIQVAMGSTVKSLRPLFENPWFMGAQGFPIGAIFLGLFFSRRQKTRLNNPGFMRKKQVNQKVNQAIQKMGRAITAHDATAFFNACRTASQERLGELWGQEPDSITLAEIKQHLGDNGEGMARVFENADAAAYSGRSFSPEELRKLRDLVVHELKNLNHSQAESRN
jgi:hypothetical protein